MTSIVLHPRTKSQLDTYLSQPSQALLIVGLAGIGKSAIASFISDNIFSLDSKLLTSRLLNISPDDKQTIGIDKVRQIEHFVSLKIPSGDKNSISRVVMIENAQNLTLEAQNALLKTIEEPPTDTAIIMTAVNPTSLLPTLRSRLHLINVSPPSQDEVTLYFKDIFSNCPSVDRAGLVSGYLPGLMHAMLSEDQEHPLLTATETARNILSQDTYGRLCLVDDLSKQKNHCIDTLYIMEQMARTALKNNSHAPRWQQVLKAVYRANDAIAHNAQVKLALSNLMLSL